VDESIESGGTLLRYDEPGGLRAVVLEDDGRVAYAYLLENGAIVNDVWLYNVAEAPASIDWQAQRQVHDLPFLNPAPFCNGEHAVRLADASNVECVWSSTGVSVRIAGVEIARLERDVRPGWSRLARRSGPLARTWE
jgi:hypothetical protein